MARARPNVLITGTPGTGKTTTAEQVCRATGLKHVNVGDWVQEHHLHSGWDEEFETYILDEDKVCDALEDLMSEGGNVVDHHSPGIFPERWFDLVVVLRTDNTVLYDRLEKRQYSYRKIQENVLCEIMMVVLDETMDSYSEEIIKVLESDLPEQLENNVRQICSLIWEIGPSLALPGEQRRD